MRRHIMAILVLGLLAQQGSHGAQAHPFMAYGVVTQSCGTWVASSGNDRELLVWWAMGFISGADFTRTLPLARTDNKAIEVWIGKFCGEHPLDPLVKAATSLVAELGARAEPR
jgi:hypothetical protein